MHKRWIAFLTQQIKKNSNVKIYVALCIILLVGASVAFYGLDQLLIKLDSASPNQLATARVSHWSGYLVDLNLENRSQGVTSVSGTWIVPSASVSKNDTFSSVWVGVGGYGETSLIQAGTEQHCVDGQLEYFAWYELLPKTINRIHTLTIYPGDSVTTTITLLDFEYNSWLITLVDHTRGTSFQKTVTYNSTMKSAEWIVERPTVNGKISTLADFGTATLTNCTATINDVSGSISNFTYTPVVMVDGDDNDIVSITPIHDDGASFQVTYIKPTDKKPVTTQTTP